MLVLHKLPIENYSYDQKGIVNHFVFHWSWLMEANGYSILA